MEEKQKVYIKGNPEKGNEVIRVLEDLGGKNTQNLQGNRSDAYYFINPDGVIYNTSIVGGIICPYIKEFYKEIKLPRLKPEYKSLYFYIDTRGQVMSDLWYNMETDKLRYKFGNCFMVFEEAKATRDKIKEILKKE